MSANGGADPMVQVNSLVGEGRLAEPRPTSLGWRLRLDGPIDVWRELTLNQLESQFDTYQRSATMTTEEASAARWTGVRLGDVLTAAGSRPGPGNVALDGFASIDGTNAIRSYRELMPLTEAFAPEVMLVWAKDGRRLPTAPGGPVQLLVGMLDRVIDTRWINRILVETDDR